MEVPALLRSTFCSGRYVTLGLCVPGKVTNLQGMFKVMTSSGGVTAFRAVMKKEVDLYVFSMTLLFSVLAWILYFRRKKDMSGEETMVLSHIQASGNEGILLLSYI